MTGPQPIFLKRTTVRPLALACYIFPAIMSFLYLQNITTAGALTEASSPAIALLWQISLGIGSVLALLGVLFQLQSWPGGLVIEALGTLILGMDLGIYWATLVFFPASSSTPWWTVMSTAAISAGCLGRTVQAMRERGQALRAAAAVR